MEEYQSLSLAKMVTIKPEIAPVLEKYHLDYCCRGKQTLSEAMAGKNDELESVKKELDLIFNRKETSAVIDFTSLSLSEIIDHIIQIHHTYVKESVKPIQEHLEKIANKHGERHPELKSIAKLFGDIKVDFELHMMKEEVILFPRIKQMEALIRDGFPKDDLLFIESPIHMMESDHETAGKAMEEIRILSNTFSPPSDACTTYKLAFDELKRFELDLHQHVHLENNILFPRALEMQMKWGHLAHK